MAIPSVQEVKTNLILTTDEDDMFISSLINYAVAYVEERQHHPDGYYTTVPEGGTEPPKMSGTTRQAVILLASHFYEARDGATGGFFADNANAADKVFEVVDRLLLLNKEWQV